MSTTTKNLGLIKPELTDPADITKLNDNWDKLDAEVSKKLPIKGENLGSGDANNCTTSTTITIGTPSNWSNLPTTLHGVLEVKDAGYYILQQYTTGSSDRRVYYRFSGSQGSTWTDWEEYSRAKDLKEVVTQLGIIRYLQLSSSESGKHAQCIKDNWNTLALNSIYLINVVAGSSRIALVQKYSSHTHGCFMLMGYGLVPEFYTISDGTWSDSGSFALASQLAKYITFDGGTMKGNIIPDVDQQRYLGFPNAAFLAIYGNNIMLAKNNVNYGHLQVADGTTTAAGAGILVLGNGTPTGNDGNGYGMIRMYNKDSGYTEITPKATKSVVLNFPTENGTLLCDADRPTGYYSGNNNSTARYINTKGDGNMLVISGNGATTFVGNYGAFSINSDGTTKTFPKNQLYFDVGNKNINMYTADARVNASGYRYDWAVL